MNGLLSLLMTSWMNDSNDINPLGDISVLEERLSRNAIMMSPRPLPLGPDNRSVLV